MKKKKSYVFLILFLIVVGYLFASRKENEEDIWQSVLEQYSENLVGSKQVDLTHDGKDDLVVVSKYGEEIRLEVYTMVEDTPTLIYQDCAADNHAGWRWYYLTTAQDHQNYILQYIPEIWNGIGTYRFEVLSFDETGEKKILETQELSYDSLHVSEEEAAVLAENLEDFKAAYKKWQESSTPLVVLGDDPLTGETFDAVLEE